MTIALMIVVVVIYFISEVLCDRMIVLQSRLRVVGVIVSVFLAVWVMAIATTHPMPDHISSTLGLTLPAWGGK